MNKRERFYAAVAGAPVDRPPLSVWMHFVTPYATGLQGAARHCEFLRQYDWDLAKAVSDYRHPLPDGMETIANPADMTRITVQSMDHPTYASQIALLNGIRAELGEDWPVVDTTFDPIQQVLHHFEAELRSHAIEVEFESGDAIPVDMDLSRRSTASRADSPWRGASDPRATVC